MNKGKIRVLLRSFDHKILDQTVLDIAETALNSGAQIIGPVPLPTKRETFTVIRGPHIDKKSQEAFERRTHCRLLDIIKPTPRTLEALSSLSLAAGVGIEIKG
ncbi:30S ribosomal protein S10 [Patescibacteria group bacterium]|nr:30S ribosomal protein S10 [Patescibacteria group bacterium]MBU1868773.1 30S ribosomal protein S10 [Patescibacteria group bacterium]